MATTLVPIGASLPTSAGAHPVAAAAGNSDTSQASDFTALLAQMNPVPHGIHNHLARPTPPSPKGGPVLASDRTPTMAQLTALLQSGVPLSSIIGRLTALLSSAVQRALPAGAVGASSQMQSSLMQSLTNALSPPGHGPPGTAAESAAALAGRLAQWLAGIAGEAKSAAGQQNDIAGHILDANSAKELPAQHEPSTLSPLDVASLAQSLLAAATAALAPPILPLPAPAQTKTTSGPPSTGTSASDSAPNSASITMANAPDLLARMLVRAATADARMNPASNAPVATSASALNTAPLSTPSALAARLAAAFANVVAEAQTAAFGDSSSQNPSGHAPGFSSGSNPESAPVQTHADEPANTSLASAPSGALPTSNQPSPIAQLPARIDTSALVEQLVRGMTMRTFQNGVSEMRLHLSPANLGNVTMKLTVNGAAITANVVAQNADVQSALINGQQQLARSLHAAGMTLSGFSVDVSGGHTGHSGQDRSSGFGRHYAIHELPTVEEPTVGASSNALPSILGASTLELFNYLV